MRVRYVLGVHESKLDNVVERNVALDHGEQSLHASFIRLSKCIENSVQGIALEFEFFDVAFASGPPSAILSLIVDTIRAGFQAIGAGLLLVALRKPVSAFERSKRRKAGRASVSLGLSLTFRLMFLQF